jgi:tripartite ATP-independent transporter DctM subunit
MLFLIGVMLLLVFLGFPVVFSIGLTSVFYMLKEGINLVTVAQRMILGIDNFAFLAVPFFILAGNVMNTGGITTRIFRFAASIVGYIPGGLAHANVIASIIFAGMSGAAIADAGGLGTIEIKAMREGGYDLGFSAAITAASSTIGPIFPPSIPMVIYGAFGGVSIGKLFLAGAIPGILMGVALMIMIYFYSRIRNYPVFNKFDSREIFVSFKEAILSLFTPVIILGGIMFGIFTVTEAAIVASAYSLFLSMIVYRQIKLRDLYQIILETILTTTIVSFIISTASVYGWILTRERVPQNIAIALFSLTDNPTLILLIIVIFLLIIGCFMETTAALIILVPIMVPMIIQLGIDPVHFGLIFVFALMLGLSTPPVGIVLYIISNISGMKFEKVVSATWPFLIPLFAVLLLIVFIPEIALFLPNLLIK